jgi:hypothetical protein
MHRLLAVSLLLGTAGCSAQLDYEGFGKSVAIAALDALAVKTGGQTYDRAYPDKWEARRVSQY